MNVLVSSAGRRGALVQLVQREIAPAGGRVYGVDAGPWSSACRLADGWRQVSRCTEDGFVNEVAEYCDDHDIGLIIPTIDTELPAYAAHRDWFGDRGVKVAVPGPETVAISADKLETRAFLHRFGLPGVRCFDSDSLWETDLPYPLIIKPRFGSASAGVHVLEDAEALRFYHGRIADPVVQERAPGDEYTVNFFADRDGHCITAVPHVRIETRGGEVSKCVTVKHAGLIRAVEMVCEHLPDAWGPLCCQAFVDEQDEIRIIEINSRFGGGYPVAHQAGANFVRWLIRDALGEPLPAPANDWQSGVAMMRWDDAVFATAKDVGRCP